MFEYKLVDVPTGDEENAEDILNDYAEDGWKLVSSRYAAGYHFIFERDANEPGPKGGSAPKANPAVSLTRAPKAK